jgi:hypothetical protein
MTEILTAVASEVAELAVLSDRLQALISAALMAQGARDAEQMRQFQAIDLLVQRLHGVSVFIEGLRAVTPSAWQVDPSRAAAAVALSDLARRLAGIGPEPSSEADASGDLELFG